LGYIPLIYITITYCAVVVLTIINEICIENNLSDLIEVIISLVSIIFPPFALVGVTIAGFFERLNVSLQKIEDELSDDFSPYRIQEWYFLVMILMVTTIFYFSNLILINKRIYYIIYNKFYKNISKKPKNKKNRNFINDNKDVHEEYILVKNNINNYAICVVNIYMERKVTYDNNNKKFQKLIKKEKKNTNYGNIHKSDYCNSTCFVKTIIDDVTFGINKQECFCILGPKCSGKTSLLDMITKFIIPTDGKIYFNGKDLKNISLKDLSISYCTENDTYWKDLNLYEQIKYELELRGCSSKDAKTYAKQYIQIFDLEKVQNIKIYLLNDTIKRIVKFIITICSQTDIIVLDEPTKGMDISSRIKIWEVIQQIQKSRPNTTIIIATSSCEETQTLCDRICILVNGQLKCIGTPEELEKNYCQRFMLKVQTKSILKFQQKILRESHLFGHDYIIEDEFESHITYNVSLEQEIGNVFEVMEQCKISGLVTEYSFSKLTLQQLYLNYAKYQIITENK